MYLTSHCKQSSRVKAPVLSFSGFGKANTETLELTINKTKEADRHLIDFFRGAAHRQMMQFYTRHPNSLCLYNEMYYPVKSGKYSHEPQGIAMVYGL